MRNFKNTLFYLVVTGGFTALMYWIVGQGKLLEVGKKIVSPSSSDSQWVQFLSSLFHNLQHPLALLLIQIIMQPAYSITQVVFPEYQSMPREFNFSIEFWIESLLALCIELAIPTAILAISFIPVFAPEKLASKRT
jgi:hypothetical protein